MLPEIGRPRLVKMTDGRTLKITITEASPQDTLELPLVEPPPPPVLQEKLQGNRAVFRPSPLPQLPCYLDDPEVGGRMTLCVLCYGDYYELHKRCLEAVFQTTAPERLLVRVGSNALCQNTLDLIARYEKEGRIEKHYRHKSNDKKYPVMREMFHDQERPLSTRWVIWFDDDTICDRNADWLNLLAQQVVAHSKNRYGAFGPLYNYNLTPAQVSWIQQARWYRKRALRDKKGNPAPNGNKAHFPTGSFWCVSREAIATCDIPDERIGHNGGDVMIGEQLWQGGYLVKNYGANKSVVNWSSVPRRGLHEKHAGA